jgi:hypothetical protein
MLLVTPISEDEIMFEDGTRIVLSLSPASSLTLARLSLLR